MSNYLGTRIQSRYGCYISPKAHFGRGVRMPHPVGIVIGDGVSIGDHVLIFQNVTIGASRVGEGAHGYYPKIGDNSVLFAGSVLVGAIYVGNNVNIGANAVVTRNIPDHSTAVGVPARIIS